MMKRAAICLLLAAVPCQNGFSQLVFDRVRFYPRAGYEDRMVGGQLTASNDGETVGFVALAAITNVPAAGQWTELTFANTTVFRWVNYQAPAGSYGNVAEVEFYSGTNRLTGTGFGTTGEQNGNDFTKALDGNTSTYFDSSEPDGQYAGLDLGASAQVATVEFEPAAGSYSNMVIVTLSCATPGAAIRYSMDGATPTETTGTEYTVPFIVPSTTTIMAVGFKAGLARSLAVAATYRVGEPPVWGGYRTYHIGNSLTDTIFNHTPNFEAVADSVGYTQSAYKRTIPGAPTEWNWNHPTDGFGEGDYRTAFQRLAPLDHLFNQPFQGRAVPVESQFSGNYYDMARHYSPNVQHWIYCQWPSPLLTNDSQAMATSASVKGLGLVPARAWEQGPANQLVYDEAIRQYLDDRYDGKETRVIPGGIALSRLKTMMESGQVPGMTDFVAETFQASDNIHLSVKGCYLISCVYFAALYNRSPEGIVTDAGSGLTAAQAAIYRRIAWDAVKNYAWSGNFLAGGTEPVVAPQLCVPPGYYDRTQLVAITTPTPGGDIRYTYDGTTPSRSNGIVYVSPLRIHPGMQLKTVAYRSGFADSPVVTAGPYSTYSPLAEASFNTPAGPSAVALHDTTDGFGWSGNWRVGNADTSVPGCNITNAASLAYGNLIATGQYAVGGKSSYFAGRQLDSAMTFFSYRTNSTDSALGRSNTTLWVSFLLRKDQNNDEAVYVVLHNNTDPTSATSNLRAGAGYFGANSNTGTNRYWTLRVGSSYYKSTLPVVVGQPALLVLRLDFGPPHQVGLYCNPATLGGPAPVTPTLTQSTSSTMTLRSLAFFGGSSPGQGAVDEVRIGDSFGAVTPVASAPAQPTGVHGATDAGTVNLTWNTAAGAMAYRVWRGTDPAGLFELVHGGVTGGAFANTGLTPGQRYYYRVESFGGSGVGTVSTTISAIVVNTGYAAWRAANFTAGEIVAGLGEVDAVAGNDEVENVMKFALGIANPKSPLGTNVLTRVAVDAEGLLALTFRRARADASYRVESSSDLQTWTPVATDPGNVGTDVTVPDPASASGTRRFLRLAVSLK